MYAMYGGGIMYGFADNIYHYVLDRPMIRNSSRCNDIIYTPIFTLCVLQSQREGAVIHVSKCTILLTRDWTFLYNVLCTPFDPYQDTKLRACLLNASMDVQGTYIHTLPGLRYSTRLTVPKNILPQPTRAVSCSRPVINLR